MEYRLINPILHQPIRTRIIAHIIAHGSCDFTQLKEQLNLSDGHLTTHMRKLLASEYVKHEKAFVNNKPRTTYYITSIGKTAFAEYIESLKQIITLV